jgi:endoribonuclease Dicer
MEKDATSDADFLDAATFARPPRPLTARRQRVQEEFQEWVREYSSQRGKDLRDATAFPQDQVDASTASLVATPREYQIELYERAKEKNIIVVLPTGSSSLSNAIARFH